MVSWFVVLDQVKMGDGYMTGCVVIDLQGLKLSQLEKKLVCHPMVGGVLLFSRNYSDLVQLKDLIAQIREYAGYKLPIMVDHEGGKIWRFKEGFTHVPAASFFGELFQQDKEKARVEVKKAATIIAKELLDCGVDLTLAPVLDLDHSISPVIGDRAFHSDYNVVVDLAKGFIEGLNSQGMASVGKHFPGHGYCTTDSHKLISVDERSLLDIKKHDLQPFTKLADKLEAIMPAHVIYPKIDKVAAGFSKIWLQEILRQEIGFKGAIISDCLSMKGIWFDESLSEEQQKIPSIMIEKLTQKAKQALLAGCDLVILAQQKPESLNQILDNLNWQMGKEQEDRILSLCNKKLCSQKERGSVEL